MRLQLRPPAVRRRAAALGLALVSAAAARRAAAQDSTAAPVRPVSAADTAGSLPCRGEVVTAIDVNPMRPPFSGAARIWRRLAHGMGLHHVTTHADVIEGLLQLTVGQPCREYERAESERVLRAQPFLASASVRALPDGPGAVRIVVTTVDEVPVRVGGRVSGSGPEALTISNENVRGRAIGVQLSGELGHAYRDGVGLRVIDYAVLGRPYTASVEAQRRTVGSLWGVSLGHPFYTDLQRAAWRLEYQDDDRPRRLVRPAGDPLGLRVRQIRWEAGGLYRRRLFSNVGAVGAALIGVRDTPAAEGIVLDRGGPMADTGVALRGRYAPFRVVRPAALIGIRSVRYVTARGFNTLTAVEDLPNGIQAGGLVGRGISAWGASDLFLAGAMYAGYGSDVSLAGLQIEIEGRRDYEVGRWDGLIASGRLAFYRKPSLRRTLLLSEELSLGSIPQLPLQLTFSETTGGLRGYRGSYLAGAARNVVRLEDRWVFARTLRRASLGVAEFVDAGSLWAGSAPYGRTVPLRASAGVSVLAAFPAGSKRLLRLDVAIPARRDGNRGWEVRFSSDDLTRRFWREPADVTRARTGPVPSSLFTWPAR